MIAALLTCCTLFSAAVGGDAQTVLVIVGAPGEAKYDEQFAAWASRWKEASEMAQARFLEIGLSSEAGQSDREMLRQQIVSLRDRPPEALWLVLIGHGTYDGRVAKFNLRGPDVSAQELAKWFDGWKTPLAVVNCASASGPFINRLSGPNRVIMTATKSGFEYNYCRFGDFLSRAITDATADLDKDEQVSLLEAFLAASSGVAEFYQQRTRLATEHALLDDNGDGLGTPASWFRGVRATRRAKDGAQPDGRLASRLLLVRSEREQALSAKDRLRRDELEQAIAQLRDLKSQLSQDDYYARLETILLELARLYQQAE